MKTKLKSPKILIPLLFLALALLVCGCNYTENSGVDSSIPPTVTTSPLSPPSSTPLDETTAFDETVVVDTTAEETTVEETTVEETTVEETTAEETTAPPPPPRDEDFVRILDYIPDAVIELRYATTNNFTGKVIYNFNDAYLRYGTVCKLKSVADELREMGFRLKIWDAFRPTEAQFKLWEVYPDNTYVANPYYGYSSHSRGNTVDITLITLDGEELQMPTGFDDFSVLADRNYSDCTPVARENATTLEEAMKNGGFVPYFGEWWHFSDSVSYDVGKDFVPPQS